MSMLEYRLKELAKFKAIDPEAVLEEAKADPTNEYPYVTAYVKLKWEWGNMLRMLERAMEDVKELDSLQWAAEKVLDDSRIDAPTDKETVWEGILYPAAKVIDDLRKRGWSDDRIRRHKITDLEIQQERHVVPSDLCVECQDPDTFVGPDNTFCSLCEDELEEVARYEHKPATP